MEANLSCDARIDTAFTESHVNMRAFAPGSSSDPHDRIPSHHNGFNLDAREVIKLKVRHRPATMSRLEPLADAIVSGTQNSKAFPM